MLREFDARLLVRGEWLLGEGVQWRPAEERVYWTDILGRTLSSVDADGKALRSHAWPERLCSFAFDPNGNMLGAFESGLFAVEHATGRRRRLTHFEADTPSTRMNDGRCDRQGRFVFGGVDEHGLRKISSVMRFDGAACETLIRGIACANSIAFSPDGRWMYFADTFEGHIYRLLYLDDARFERDVAFATLTAREGFPDGSCVDRDGALWNAQFEGGTVRRFLPNGQLNAIVRVDAPQVTCCCFGGPDLNRLFITTARENMSSERLASHPLSGSLFYVDLPFRGLPETELSFHVTV